MIPGPDSTPPALTPEGEAIREEFLACRRGTWIWCGETFRRTGRGFIPAERHRRPDRSHLQIIRDWEGGVTDDGTVLGGNRQLRDHMRDHGLVHHREIQGQLDRRGQHRRRLEHGQERGPAPQR